MVFFVSYLGHGVCYSNGKIRYLVIKLSYGSPFPQYEIFYSHEIGRDSGWFLYGTTLTLAGDLIHCLVSSATAHLLPHLRTILWLCASWKRVSRKSEPYWYKHILGKQSPLVYCHGYQAQ